MNELVGASGGVVPPAGEPAAPASGESAAPLLLVSGGASAAAPVEARVCVTEVVLDDCGHYPAEEQPARFTQILEDCLEGRPRRSGDQL